MSHANDFKSSVYNYTAKSKSQIVPSDHQLEYKAGQTLRFEIPQFFSYIDPRQTYLKFKVKVNNASTIVRFSNKSGIHSLFSNLRIYDANSNLVLENIQNYSELAEKLHIYSENRAIRNKRGLTELLEYTSRDFDGEAYDNLPSRNAMESQLFDSYETGDGPQYTSANRGVTANNECEVAVRLYSGILGALSHKMYPALLNGGLRMEIDLNSSGKALQTWCNDGICNDDGSLADDLDGSCRFGILDADGGNAPVTAIYLYTEKNAGFIQTTFGGAPTQEPTQPSIDAGVRPVRNQLVGACNIQVGSRVWAKTNANPAVIVDCGTVASLESNAGENANNLVWVKLNLNPASTIGGGNNPIADTLVGGAGRDQAGNAQNADNNVLFLKRSEVFASEPEVVLTDVELVVKTAQPTDAYKKQVLDGINTKEGAIHDYFTYSTYRNTVQQAEQIAQINIPCQNQMATSVLVLPVKNGIAESIAFNNNETIVDNADNYNFLVNNKMQPTRKVSVASLSNAQPTNSQIGMWENEKALSSSKVVVRNLELPEENFMFARALSRYGGVMKADGNVQLKVEYKGVPNAPEYNKLMISQFGSIRRLRVSAVTGSTVEM